MKAKFINVEAKYYSRESHEWESRQARAILTSFQGHDVYVLEQPDYGYRHPVYDENGEYIRCTWTFGRTGKALRWGVLALNDQQQILRPHGLHGADGKGAVAYLRFIDWTGEKFAEALAKAQSSGKRLLAV